MSLQGIATSATFAAIGQLTHASADTFV